jgi:3-hydroxyacyl-[acyl-carrier-protein] dehydratase
MKTKELLNDFYTITSLTNSDNHAIIATITLNPEHIIFKGHFEAMPVVPGVCQLQIIKELLEKTLTLTLQTTTGDNIKFTGMIVPTNHSSVIVEINYKQNENNLIVDSKIYHESTIFTKSKTTYQIIN